MQYWIFYEPGVGGDGFACLLEHANNVYPADGQLQWRFHFYNGFENVLKKPIRFFQSHWCEDPIPFRNFGNLNSAKVNPIYLQLI